MPTDHRPAKHAWRQFAFGLLCCFVQAEVLLAAETGALRIEESQRAFQERHQMLFGQRLTWPVNALGEPAPDFPPDGFYAADLSNAVTAAALVSDLADKFDTSGLLEYFTSAKDGEIEGSDGNPPLLSDTLPLPLPRDITTGDYPAQFTLLVQALCAARYVVLNPDNGGTQHVGIDGISASYPEYRDGWARNENQAWILGDYSSAVCSPVSRNGALLMRFKCWQFVDLGVDLDHVKVMIATAGVSSAAGKGWQLGSVPATEGDFCGVPNVIPKGTVFPVSDLTVAGAGVKLNWQLSSALCSTCAVYNGFQVTMQWFTTYDCDGLIQAANDVWNYRPWMADRSWWTDFHVVTWSEPVLDELGTGAVHKRSTRGKVSCNLANFTGSARCYLYCGWSGDIADYDPPVTPDYLWHFYQTATTGIEWVSSALGDAEPVFRSSDCQPGSSVHERGWNAVDTVIVTPDFQYNIEECGTCTACAGGGDSCAKPGSTDLSLADRGLVSVGIGLGLDSFGRSAGQLTLRASRPGSHLYSPAALGYQTLPGTEVLRGADRALRQVRTTTSLVNIVPLAGAGYEIRFYTAANTGHKDGSGFYVPTGPPYKTIAVANPDPSGSTSSQLQVTETTDGESKLSRFVWSDANQHWTLTTGNGLRQESRRSVWDSQYINRTETCTVTDGNGQTVYKEQQTFHVYDWGEELIRKVIDPGGTDLTTTWSYYDSWADPNNYSHLKQTVLPSGNWERYRYDSLGRQTEAVSQYLDAPLGAPNDQCRVTTALYATNDPAVTVVETIQGQEISRHYTVYRPGETRDIEAVVPGAAWNDPSNLVTVTRTYLGTLFEGKIHSITRPDGTMSICQYAHLPAVTGSNLVTTVSTGQPNGDASAIVNGTRTVTTENLVGATIREETYDITDGTHTLLTWYEAGAVDDFGRATRLDYSDGTSASTVQGCCGILSASDREGIATSYSYDALNRLATSIRAGITTTNCYDAAGRVLSTTRIGSDQSAINVKESAYDVAGRLTSSTDALTNTTQYAESIDNNGHTVKTTTYPDHTTRIETHYQDGALFSVTGSAVHGVRYEYGVEANGRFTREIALTADGTATGEWTKTYTDMVGRPSVVAHSDGSTSHSHYNEKGQLEKQVDEDGVTTLYAYDPKGELELTALDMDGNGHIDFGGTDRITKMQRSVLTAHGTSVQRTTTTVYTTAGTEDTTVVSIHDASADGLQSWSIQHGLTNHVQAVYDVANARRTVTTTNPDDSYSVARYKDGRLELMTAYDPVGRELSAIGYQYDSHGRLQTINDARAGATTCTYNDADQIVRVISPPPSPGSPAPTASYQYDSIGRRTLIRLPDNGTIATEYFDTGEPRRTYGDRTYPVEFTYDYAGRMKTMTTWKDFADETSKAITTWNYDQQRGWLNSKLYDDRTGPTYTYTDAGRLKTRTWARSSRSGEPITTTYDYNNAGDLQTIAYNDDTPSVALSYDRRGWRVSASSASLPGGQASAVDFAYNDAGQLTAETWTAGPLSGINVISGYDSLLRRSSLSSGAGVSPVSYSYDAASRLSSVSNGTHSATYAYLPESSLVSNIVFQTDGVTRMTTTKTWDNLNRLSAASSQPSAGGTISYTYDYNVANQRAQVTLGDGSYWIYQYDSLGQVASGKKYWSDGAEVAGQQFGYNFDDIGNRIANNANGRESAYDVNNLNQYTQRTVPGFVWELGSAANNATVTINNQPVSRRSGFQPRPEMAEYFWKDLSVDNTDSAVYTQLVTVGVLKNAGSNQLDIVSSTTGSVFVAQSPEQFTCDDDGNLTSDGRWTYTWDAENRLVSMETRVDVGQVPSPGVPRQKLLFGYDYQGRRIQKKVFAWETDHWSLVTDLRFVYDGWNLIAEFSALDAPSAPTLIRSYTWGLDLSGTEQEAGGIGGLLFIGSRSLVIGDYGAAYDGNGNVVSLIDMATGQLAAAYEYGPFGEPIRATGPVAAANPLRFSTKYTDPETGLLYYGYRYYMPRTGRWFGRDPIAERGGPNSYSFVANRPVDSVDPLGLFNLQTHARLTTTACSRLGEDCVPCRCDSRRFLESLARGAVGPDLQLNMPGATGLLGPGAFRAWNAAARIREIVEENPLIEWTRHVKTAVRGAVISTIPGGTDIQNWWENTTIGGTSIQVGHTLRPDVFNALYQTHYGANAWQHGMAVSGLTARQLQQQLVNGTLDLLRQYRRAMNDGQCDEAAFALGKGLHYLQDTYTPSHTMRRNGAIVAFLDYNKQSATDHAKVDNPSMKGDVFGAALGVTSSFICMANNPSLSDEAYRRYLEQVFYQLGSEAFVGGPGPYALKPTRIPNFFTP